MQKSGSTALSAGAASLATAVMFSCISALITRFCPSLTSLHYAGLTYDAQNAPLQSALKDAQKAKSQAARGGAGGGSLFGPDFLNKLRMNPQTRPLLSQPDFLAMLQDMGNNPANMNKYLGDPRLQQALSVGMGINMMSGDDFKKGEGAAANGSAAGPASASYQDGAVESDDDMPVSLLFYHLLCSAFVLVD